MPHNDYKITFHGNYKNNPIECTKNRFMNARLRVEKLMIGLKPGEKIVIEREEK